MRYAEDTVDNKNIFKRFSHKRRFIEAKNLLNEYKFSRETNMLDFGSGNGFFVKYLIENEFKLNFSAYDPVEQQISEMKDLFNSSNIKNVNIYNQYDSIIEKFDIICCLETLEHFDEVHQRKLLEQMKKLLKPGGIIIISVPIEVYLSGFIKMILRITMRQSQENTNFKNLFKTLFGMKISSPDIFKKNYLNTSQEYLNTHVGFYYFNLIKLIKRMNFKIVSTKYSPFPILKSLINSQIFIKIK